MKKIVLTLCFILFSHVALASEEIAPFSLASNYPLYLKLAQSEQNFEDVQTSFNEENPYVKEDNAEEAQILTDADDKWNVIKDFEEKPKSLSGEVSFGASENVKIDAFAGYTFPEKTLAEQTEELKRKDDSYSLKINVEVAL